jgi:nucleoside-diphosphate-sugar epimerase
MRVLFIGGTGNISGAVTREALGRGIEVYHLNRGNRPSPEGVRELRADIGDRAAVVAALGTLEFDAVVDWIAFKPDQVKRDIELFAGRTGQYVFISSASAYRKPLSTPRITESTPLGNPYWDYARAKIECEDVLVRACRETGFPATIVRPSHTYGDGWIPTTFGSGDFTVAQRMIDGKPIIIHGDGQSLWTLTSAVDFARGFIGLLGEPAAVGEAFHITSDESLTWDSIHAIIADAFGAKPEVIHIPTEVIAAHFPERGPSLAGDKKWSVVFDNTKIKRFVPGFSCAVTFAEGMRRARAWYDTRTDSKVVNAKMDAEIDALVAFWQSRVLDPNGRVPDQGTNPGH